MRFLDNPYKGASKSRHFHCKTFCKHFEDKNVIVLANIGLKWSLVCTPDLSYLYPLRDIWFSPAIEFWHEFWKVSTAVCWFYGYQNIAEWNVELGHTISSGHRAVQTLSLICVCHWFQASPYSNSDSDSRDIELCERSLSTRAKLVVTVYCL